MNEDGNEDEDRIEETDEAEHEGRKLADRRCAFGGE